MDSNKQVFASAPSRPRPQLYKKLPESNHLDTQNILISTPKVTRTKRYIDRNVLSQVHRHTPAPETPKHRQCTSSSNLSTTAKRIVEKLYKKYVQDSSSFSSSPAVLDLPSSVITSQLHESSLQSFSLNSVLHVGGETNDMDLIMELWDDEVRPSEEAEAFDSVSYYDLARQPDLMVSASLVPEESDETGLYDSQYAMAHANLVGIPFTKPPKFLENPLPVPFKISRKELDESWVDKDNSM